MLFFPRLFVLAPQVIETFGTPPRTVTVPLFIWITRGEGYVQNCALNLFGLAKTTTLNTRVSALDMSEARVMEVLDGENETGLPLLVSKGVYAEASLDISALRVPEGRTGLARVTVDALVDGRCVRTRLRIPYRASRLPKEPGWYGGDCHTHSSWSPDVWLIPLSGRARYAWENGFGFLIMSDHSSGVSDWAGPDGYVAQCDRAQQETGIPILPALEVEARDGGHYLCYSLKPTSAQHPTDGQYPCRDLVKAVSRHDFPLSYGMIAHPFAARSPWGDWSAYGFAGLELMNRQRTANRTTVQAWFGLLRTNLPHTVATGEFVAAIGGSDSHNFMQPGSRGFTWAYIPDYSAPDRSKVWEAIRRGQTSVSGAKDLAYFTVDGQMQGSVLRRGPGEPLQFHFRYLPVTGRRCTQITLMDKNLKKVFETVRPPGSELRWTMPPSDRDPEDTFYVAAFTFREGKGDVSEVWTNPVFVSSRV